VPAILYVCFDVLTVMQAMAYINGNCDTVLYPWYILYNSLLTTTASMIITVVKVLARIVHNSVGNRRELRVLIAVFLNEAPKKCFKSTNRNAK
jgi:hypothetical protein